MSVTLAPPQSSSAPTSLSKPNNVPLKAKPSASPQQPSAAPTSSMSTVKSKKDSSKPSKSPSTVPVPPPPKSQTHEQMKKISRRSSKPIINWFQRKLAGTVRARRASESQRYGAPSPRGKEKQHRRSSVPMPPPLATSSRTRNSTTGSRQTRAHSLRGTISLNETNDDTESRSFQSDSDDGLRPSVARDSLYSPTSYLEADEDASVRPLPPSSPPSPSPSRSSSSYLSHSRTFRSMTASTKPTTLLSVDLTGGMAHIAQAPPTPTTPGHRIPPHIRTHSSGPSAGSITFSAIPPPSPTSPSRPSSGNSGAAGARGASLTAPLYTTHHPRNNPRPSSPPPDDASVLTLASSAFGMPGARIGAAAFALSGRGSIADDSISQWSNVAGLTDSTSHFMMGDLEEGLEEERYHYHDVDASVRALRPRSSRRGSWDSMVSGWSANVVAGAPSPGGLKSKSMWTSGSFRTGGVSTEEAIEDGLARRRDEEEEDSVDSGDSQTGEETEAASTAYQTNDSESSAPTDRQKQSTGVVETPSTNSQSAKVSVVQEVEASTKTFLGVQVQVPAATASTVTLPGSKMGSEIPSPEDASERGTKDRASTPTKVDTIPAEVDATVAPNPDGSQTKGMEDPKDEDRRASAQLSPLSPASTAHSEYLSAPSTPAAA